MESEGRMTTETKTEVGTMRVDEAAKRLGIARQTAYDLAARGELPGVLRLGRRILISRKQLEAFLEGKGK
jgi:excisionase family DNA binding protein